MFRFLHRHRHSKVDLNEDLVVERGESNTDAVRQKKQQKKDSTALRKLITLATGRSRLFDSKRKTTSQTAFNAYIPSDNENSSSDDDRTSSEWDEWVGTLGTTSSVKAGPDPQACIELMPVEIVAMILTFLPPTHDICNAAMVCKRWRILISSYLPLRKLRSQHKIEARWCQGRYIPKCSVALRTHPIWQLHPCPPCIPQTGARQTGPRNIPQVFHYSGMDGNVQLLDLATQSHVRKRFVLPAQNFPIIAINNSRTRLVISGRSEYGFTLEEFDYANGNPVKSLVTHRGWITCMQFVDEDRIVSGSQDNKLAITNLATGKRELVISGHLGFVTCLQTYRSNGQIFLVSGSLDGTVRKWNLETGACVQVFDCRFPICYLHTDGNLLAAGGCQRENRSTERGRLKVIDLNKSKWLHNYSRLSPLAGVYICGHRMLTVESGWMSFRCRKFRKAGAIKLWDTRSGRLVRKIVDFRLREQTNKSQCVVSFLVDGDRNIILGLEEMEHLRPSPLSHVFRIKSCIKAWSLSEW